MVDIAEEIKQVVHQAQGWGMVLTVYVHVSLKKTLNLNVTLMVSSPLAVYKCVKRINERQILQSTLLVEKHYQ